MTDKAVRYGIVGVAVVLLVVAAFAGAASADPFEIRTIDDWKDNMTGTNNCILMNDIDFNGGNDAYIQSFSGTLDGKYHTIYNFSIPLSDTNSVGIFGSYSGTSISNLTISNFSVSGNTHVGGLVGYAGATSTFKNVIVMNGDVTGVGSIVGGMVGSTNYMSKNIDNCTVKNCRMSGGDSVGGLVGSGYSGSVTVYESGVNDCDISAGMNYVGGIVGHTYGASVTVNESCVNGCYISADNGFVGGLVGSASTNCAEIDLQNSEVANCVMQSESGYSGGLLGCNYCTGSYIRNITDCTVSNCVIYASSSSGSRPCGGIIGGCSLDGSPTEYSKVSNCTVEFCTIAGQGSNAAGGIAGTFPTAGTLDRNEVISSCIVSKTGKAAGICPTAATTS